MSITRFQTAAGLVSVLLGGVLALPRAGAANPSFPLLRYRLQVGQELLYSGGSEFKYEGSQSAEKSTWRVWVVRQNKEGDWRLVIRQGISYPRAAGDGKAQAVPEFVIFSYCDIQPNGRMEENDSFGFRQMLSKLLPPLPENEDQARRGWTVKETRLEETLRCRLLPESAGAESRGVEVVRDAPLSIINGYAAKDIVTFDTQRGLPEKIVSQTRTFKGKAEGVIKLDEIKTHDADWARRIDADAERYFAARQAYEKATGRPKTAADLTAALDKAAANLKATRAELQLPDFQKQLDEMISRHDYNAKRTLENAKKWGEVVGKPAAEWSTTDFDGKAHALQDYRGKVVILDFWHRHCGWCIRSMPQMKQIAEYFEDKPVVVFGMNNDSKEEDAKFVIDKMALNYRNLKATDLLEKYKVHAFPTLLILDPQGIIRDIHVGYSPTLKDDVVRSVERLLQTKP